MLFGDELKEQWQEVMKKRGNPMASPPKRSANFPKLKHESTGIVPGQIRGVKIKTSRTARWVKS